MTLRDLFLRNFWVKLLSVVLATVIWIAINGFQADLSPPSPPIINPAVQDSMPLVVNVLTQSGDARIFKVTPEKVLVTVTGESAVLRKYSRRDFRAYVDLTTIRTNEPPSQEVRIHGPDRVTVLNITPQAVNVEQISP